MRRLWAATMLACGVGAAGLTGMAPAQAAATCNGLHVTITGTAGNDVRTGTPGNDVFSMGAGNDVVTGLAGNDTACLGTGDDRFTGGAGDDTFMAEAVTDGRDVFVGDDGGTNNGTGPADVASYAARTVAVTVSLDAVADDGQAGEGDLITGADVDVVRGGSGADVLTERAPGQRTLFGGPGNDTLSGASALFGDAGDDVLIHPAGTGSGFLHGGDGADRLTDRSDARSSLQGDAGADRISGGPGDGSLFGGPGDDRLGGGSGDEFISGDDGDDILTGGLGDDGIAGGNGDAGNDTFMAGVAPDGADTFFGGEGTDTANYGARDNLARATVVNLSAAGFGNDGEPGEGDTTDAENLKGGTGRNILTGDARANRLDGGPTFDLITSIDQIGGNDVIVGNSGPGIDRCDGDPGPPPDLVRC